MKICLFVENYYRGGVETVVKQLLEDWKKADFEVLFITNDSNPILKEANYRLNFIDVQTFNFITCSNWFAGTSKWTAYRSVNVVLNVLRKMIKSLSFLLQVMHFKRRFQTVEAEIFFNINGGYPGSLSSRAASIGWAKKHPDSRQIMAIHQLVEKSRLPLRFIDNYIDSKIFTNIDKIITVSEICRLSFKNRKNIAICKSQVVIRNAANLDLVDAHTSALKREVFNIDRDTKIFLMVASYELRKGHSFLLQCVAKVREQNLNCHLICVGDDPTGMIPDLVLASEKLEISEMVTFLRYRDDVSAFFELCDVVVIPSQTSESSSLVAIEALSHRKPIVATNVGALVETIPHGLGAQLFHPSDIDGFARALIELSLNTELYSWYANESSKQASKFSIENMLSSYRSEMLNLI